MDGVEFLLSADAAKSGPTPESPLGDGIVAPQFIRRTVTSGPLAQRATQGFAWLMLQTFATKAVGLGAADEVGGVGRIRGEGPRRRFSGARAQGSRRF